MPDLPVNGARCCGGPPLRWLALLVCALVWLTASPGEPRAQSPAVEVPRPPADVVAAKAYGALERTCSRCHQAGRLEDRAPGAGLANILSLDEIARDPALVRPGVPDASRLYNVALTRELHHDIFNDPAAIEPTPLEVQALRDWISERPPDAAPAARSACPGRAPVTPRHMGALLDMAVAGLPPNDAPQTRYLSLAHLYNACLPDAEIEVLRRGAAELLESLAPQGTAGPVGGWAAPADPRRLLLAVSLTSLGWSPSDWDKLVADYPLRAAAAAAIVPAVRRTLSSEIVVVHADWFASTVLAHAISRPARESQAHLWGLPPTQALAQAWSRPADLHRVRADLGLTATQDLAGLPGFAAARHQLAAGQLRAGAVARRAALDRLYPALLSDDVTPAGPLADERLEIALEPDKPSYRTGDMASFAITTSRDCFLTLVGVDRAGRATVLFPNELEPDNRIAAGARVRVPGEKAAYRFRFKEKGRETVVAICSQSHKAPEGVHHDYDRLRFTVLGDWQLLLREPPDGKVLAEARRDDAATDIPRPGVRQRRRGPAPKPDTGPTGADVQTRTAITIDIE